MLWDRIKWPLAALVAVALIIVAAWAFLHFRGCGDRPAVPSSASQRIPDGWQAAPVVKTPWLPFKANEASEYTAEFPAGSRVVVVKTKDGQEVKIGVLPDGTIVGPVDVEYTVTVYEKRALFQPEFRPYLGAGVIGAGVIGPDGVTPAVAAGVDLLKIWRVNAGVGAVAGNDSIAVIASAAYPLWRNVDLRAGGGYGTPGGVGFVGASIGVE